ncbi:MAG: DUF1289 domain-containing protein [Alphaproteobacteria bacterium]
MMPKAPDQQDGQKIRRDPRTGIDTPCIYVCTIDGLTGYCLGCYRSRPEVERWTKMSDAERDEAMAKFDARKEEASQKRKDYMARRQADAANT